MSASFDTEGPLTEEFPIDPFGAMPNWASRLSGLGGPDPSPNPNYVLRTVPVRPGIGSVTFSLHFFELAASRGTLLIEVSAVSAFPGAEPSPLDTLSIPLGQLAAEKGLVEVRVTCRRNTLYGLSAEIVDDTDATCASIVVTADCRSSAHESTRHRGRRVDLAPRPMQDHADAFIRSWVTGIDSPSFDMPTSQGWTPKQARNPHFASLVNELGLQEQPAEEAWRQAYLLRAIDVYATHTEHPSCIGFTSEPCALPSALAARGADVLLVEHSDSQHARLDPGLALERHFLPNYSNGESFFQHVFTTHGNWLNISPSLHDRFDFLWSLNAHRKLDIGQFVHFVLSTITCVRAGGMAVHVFDFADQDSAQTFPALLDRTLLERLVAHALSHLNEVAILRFRRSEKQAAAHRSFGLIMRRGIPR